jgi:RHS repeat-associated protein
MNSPRSNRWINYNWDNAGNRTQVNDNGWAYSYGVNSLNQYAWSGDGGGVGNGSEHEIGSYQGISYGYYGDRRLASVSGPGGTYNLAYDGLGRTVQRSLNGVTTYYVYDGEKPVYEYKADGSTAGWNVYGKGIDEPLLRADYVAAPGGQGYFYQQDHEGSVTHLTGWGGEVIESYRYDAFGAPTTTYSAGNFNNRFKFTGREYVPQFGIYEYRNRAYHPGLGRFMSEDPSGFSAGDYNLFRYCGNDPVDRSDPTGLLDTATAIWNMAKFFDSSSTFQGGYNEFMQHLSPAGTDGGQGGENGATVTGTPTRQANLAPESDTPTSDSTKSMEMTIATDPANSGHQKFEDDGYYRLYSVQLTQPNGKAQDGRGWYAQEEVKVRANQCAGPGCHDGKFDVQTTNGRPLYELPRSGQARDRVGLLNPPKHNTSGNVIKDQRWWLQHGTEHRFLLPGVLRQTTTVKDGKSYNGLAPTSEPW